MVRIDWTTVAERKWTARRSAKSLTAHAHWRSTSAHARINLLSTIPLSAWVARSTRGASNILHLRNVEFALLATRQRDCDIIGHVECCVELSLHDGVCGLAFEVRLDIFGRIAQEVGCFAGLVVSHLSNSQIVGFCSLVDVPEVVELWLHVGAGCRVARVLFDGWLDLQSGCGTR